MFRLWVFIPILVWLSACGAPSVSPSPFATTVLPHPLASPLPTTDPYADQRALMVERDIISRGVSDPLVLDAMRTVPRHAFVLAEYLPQAYDDHPLPIGYGQTISQPFIVALMSEALQVQPGERVLEIGTGSGYQAAVLAQMGAMVYSVEIIPELAQLASARLEELGYAVEVRQADGYDGWEEFAPYDGIIVTCAPDHLPPALLSQLAEGGRLVIPIGPVGDVQTLWLFEKTGGDVETTNLGGVRFVPLTRAAP